jgi:hypothetical protein
VTYTLKNLAEIPKPVRNGQNDGIYWKVRKELGPAQL